MLGDRVGIEDLVGVIGQLVVGVVKVPPMRDAHGFKRRRSVERFGGRRTPIDAVHIVAVDNTHAADVVGAVLVGRDATKRQRISASFELSHPFPRKQRACRRSACTGRFHRRLGIFVTQLGFGLAWTFLRKEGGLVGQTGCVAPGSIDVGPMNLLNLRDGRPFEFELISRRVGEGVGHSSRKPGSRPFPRDSCHIAAPRNTGKMALLGGLVAGIVFGGLAMSRSPAEPAWLRPANAAGGFLGGLWIGWVVVGQLVG